MSATIMALECALRMQLEHKHFVTKVQSPDGKLVNILKVSTMYESIAGKEDNFPADTRTVLETITRYKEHLSLERVHHFVLPRCWELTQLAVQCGREFKSEISCAVSKGTETVFIHFHYPLLAQIDHEFDVIEALLFDPHRRTHHDFNASYFLKFEDTDSLESYLNAIWPKMDMGPNPNLHGNEMALNRVKVEVIALNPNLRTRPRIMVQELKRDFAALAAKMEAVRQRGDIGDIGNDEDDDMDIEMVDHQNNAHFGYQRERVNAMPMHRDYRQQSGSPDRDQNRNQNRNDRDQRVQIQPLQTAQSLDMKRNQNAVPFDRSNHSRSRSAAAMSPDPVVGPQAVGPQAVRPQAIAPQIANQNGDQEQIQILQATVQSLQEMVNTLRSDKERALSQCDAMRSTLDQRANGHSQNADANAEILKLRRNRSYLIEQLQQRNDEMDRLRTQFEQMKTAKNEEIELRDTQIASLQQQVDDLQARQLANGNGNRLGVNQPNPRRLDRGGSSRSAFGFGLEEAEKRRIIEKQKALEHTIGLESVMSAINENGERFVQCPTPNCQNGAIVPDHVLKFECNECGQKWCPKCKRSYHHNETCKEYADRKALEEQMNDAQLR